MKKKRGGLSARPRRPRGRLPVRTEKIRISRVSPGARRRLNSSSIRCGRSPCQTAWHQEVDLTNRSAANAARSCVLMYERYGTFSRNINTNPS